MRVHTFLSILLAFIGTVFVAYLTQENTELLRQRFHLSETATVPVYTVLIGAFLIGFLPVVTLLVVRTLRQDLASRRQRRFDREARSLQGSYRRAVDLQEDGQWPQAAAELEAVMADQPEDFATLLRYGEVLRRQGRIEEALDIHRRASVLYPQSVAVLYQLADDYEAQGSPDVAREIQDRILRDFPGLGLKILKQRRLQSTDREEWSIAQRLQESIEALEGSLEGASLAAEEQAVRQGLVFERGASLLENEEFEESEGLFLAILEINPEFVPARILLGELRLMRGDAGAAVAEWGLGWETTGSPIFLQRIEDHYIEREQPMEAIETLRRIIARADEDLVPRFFLGKLYARLEMHDEALKVLGNLRDRVHESPALLYLMGRLYERRGDVSRAGEAYRTSLELARVSTDLYLCGRCGTDCETWLARCESCGSWNTIELHFDAEPVGGGDSLIRDRPVWPIHDES